MLCDNLTFINFKMNQERIGIKMKKLFTAALSLMFVVCLSYTAVAGSLDSPGAPSAGSGMYTLQNLYDYLTSGAALTVQTGFQEPTSAPGSTMKTTKEIGDGVQALFTQCPVTAANVESGVKFFCTQPGSWGVRTGMAQLVPTPTPTPTITPTPDWYLTYGPSGTGDVVKIGTMYVASKKDGLGGAGNATKWWSSACSWGTDLVWLGMDDWRLPTLTELSTICGGRASLASFEANYYWSSTTDSTHWSRVAFYVDGTMCGICNDTNPNQGFYVRAIRTAP